MGETMNEIPIALEDPARLFSKLRGLNWEERERRELLETMRQDSDANRVEQKRLMSILRELIPSEGMVSPDEYSVGVLGIVPDENALNRVLEYHFMIGNDLPVPMARVYAYRSTSRSPSDALKDRGVEEIFDVHMRLGFFSGFQFDVQKGLLFNAYEGTKSFECGTLCGVTEDDDLVFDIGDLCDHSRDAWAPAVDNAGTFATVPNKTLRETMKRRIPIHVGQPVGLATADAEKILKLYVGENLDALPIPTEYFNVR